MNTLPSGWARRRLLDVVDKDRRITYGIVQPGPRQRAGVRMIRGKDYSSGRVDDRDLYCVAPEISASYQRSLVQGGDILLSIVGYLGQVAIVPNHLTGANITQTTARVAIAPPNHGPFFFQQFQGSAFRKEIERYKKGSAQPGLNLADVEKMEVLVPPLPEQRKIAAILSSVDETIERTEAVIAQLDVVKKAMLEELLTRGMPGRHKRFKRTEIGEVPEEWCVDRLDRLGVVQTGLAKNKSNGVPTAREVPYLSVANVQDGALDLAGIKMIRVDAAVVERYRVRPGDVLFCEGGDADKVGRGCVWRGEVELCLHQNHVFVVRPDPRRLLPDFLSAYRASARGRRYFMDCAKQTTNLASINSSQLRGMPIVVPPIEEQGEIVRTIATIEHRWSMERESRQRLRAVKNSLAGALLSGQLRVESEMSAA